MVNLLESPNPAIQFESCWALTNVTSGTSAHTSFAVEQGIIPPLKSLLSSPYDDLREQATWALGNIAGDTPELRDIALSQGVIDPIIKILNCSSKTSILRNTTRALSNLCRGKPPPSWDLVKSTVPVFTNLINNSKDEQVLCDACWGLCHHTHRHSAVEIQQIVDGGCVPKLFQLLNHSENTVQIPALRAIAGIAASAESTQFLIDVGVLPILRGLLFSHRRPIRFDACYIMTQFKASQIQAVIDAGIVPKLIGLSIDMYEDIATEAVLALNHIASQGSCNQVEYLIKLELLETIWKILDTGAPLTVLIALKLLRTCLKRELEETSTSFISEIAKSCDIVENLRALVANTPIGQFINTQSRQVHQAKAILALLKLPVK